MLKIGDFSKLSRISNRMLRYYDENNILKPAYIETESGYRFYDTKQIYTAAQIRFFKEVGFSIAVMKEILNNLQNNREVKSYLHIRLQELYDEQQVIQETIIRLKNAEELLDKEDIYMNYEVQLKEIPSIYVVSTRGKIPKYEREDLMWKRLMSELDERDMKVKFVKQSKQRTYYYDIGFKEQDVEVEVCKEVSGTYKDIDHLHFKTLPQELVASVLLKGNFNQMADVCMAITVWVNEHDYELCGPNFCIYHVNPGEVNSPEDNLVEVCFPIQK